METPTIVAPAPQAPAVKAPVPDANNKAPITAPDGLQPNAKEGDGKSPDAAAQTPQDPAKPYQIKVNGKVMNVSIDELRALAQKGIGAESKFSEAARIREQTEAFRKRLKEDPIAALTDPSLGLEFDKIAQDHLFKKIQREQLSPEQRELAELREKLKASEDEKMKTLEAQKAQEHEALVQHYNEQHERDIMGAMEQGKLPKTPQTVSRFARYMLEGLTRGITLKPVDLIEIVRNDYLGEIGSLFGTSEGDQLLQMLGEPVLKKIREAELKKIQSGREPRIVTPGKSFAPSNDGQTQKQDSKSWLETLEHDYK